MQFYFKFIIIRVYTWEAKIHPPNSFLYLNCPCYSVASTNIAKMTHVGDLENKQVDTIWGCQYGSSSKDKWQLSLRWSLHKSTLCNPTALLMIHPCPTHGHSSLNDLLFGCLQCTPYEPVLKDHSEALAGPECSTVVCIVIGVFGFSYAI